MTTPHAVTALQDETEPSHNAPPCVVAVVVAWNRRDLLRRGLDGLAGQRRPLDGVVVIDNASTDDSAAVAREHPIVTEVVTMPENLGGAGGFAAGIARAVVTHGADLVWIMDDDTIPTPDALAALLDARLGYDGEVALLASRADWTDGREHPMNTPRERFGISDARRARAVAVGAQEVRSASFVSILLDAAAVRAEGLPIADFFLWNDDFEYTARILRHRVGLYVPASRVVHATKTFGSSDVDPGARFFNETRNKVWTFTRSSAFGARDRALYGGSTLLRWARMLARSHDRGALARYGAAGLRAGVRAPRRTADVVQGPSTGDDQRVLRPPHRLGRAADPDDDGIAGPRRAATRHERRIDLGCDLLGRTVAADGHRLGPRSRRRRPFGVPSQRHADVAARLHRSLALELDRALPRAPGLVRQLDDDPHGDPTRVTAREADVLVLLVVTRPHLAPTVGRRQQHPDGRLVRPGDGPHGRARQALGRRAVELDRPDERGSRMVRVQRCGDRRRHRSRRRTGATDPRSSRCRVRRRSQGCAASCRTVGTSSAGR